METSEFQELLGRVRNRDQQVAALFHHYFEPHVRREARLHLTDPRLQLTASVADVCQSVFLSFFTSLFAGGIDFDDTVGLLEWLRKTTVNKVRKLGRREKAQRRDLRRRVARGTDHLRSVPDPDAEPSRVVIARDLLEQLLRRLPPELRPVALARGQRRTWTELAAEHKTSPDALRKQLERALDEIAQQYGAEEFLP